MLSVHADPVGILVDTLIPEIDHDRLHGWSAGDLNSLMLVNGGAGPLPWVVVAEAGPVLDVEAEERREVIEIGANHAGASVTVALSFQTKGTHVPRSLPIWVHNLLIADVVCDEVTAASDDLDGFQLPIEDIWRREVHIANNGSQLDGHLDQLGLLRVCLGREDEAVLENDVVLDIRGEQVRLIQR